MLTEKMIVTDKTVLVSVRWLDVLSVCYLVYVLRARRLRRETRSRRPTFRMQQTYSLMRTALKSRRTTWGRGRL